MHYYKDQTNQVYALDSTADEHFLPAGIVPITLAEADAIRNPPLTLDQAKVKQTADLYVPYSAAIQADIAYMNTTFNADDATQLLIVKVLSAGQVPAGFFWQDINNNQIPMIYSQVQGFAATILIRAQAAFVKLQQLKAQIRAATDIHAVQLIIWANG
jgi:hypothetical protein